MTLSERNTFFKIGVSFCAVCVLLILAASFLIIPLYQEGFYDNEINKEPLSEIEQPYQKTDPDLTAGIPRPASYFQSITSRILDNYYLAVHVSIIVIVLFSLIGMLLIHYYFERTSAPEIMYISIFIVSLSFEVIRLILPLQHIFIFSSFYVLITYRLLLFARFFGIFSLFTASICAAGLEIQKTRNVIFIIVIAALLITFSVPIDVLNWDTSLNIVNGYVSIFRMIELSAFITIMIGFLIASNIQESKEYVYVAVGSMLVMIGRNILIHTDNWIGPGPGIIMLSFGTWFLCSKLHKIHLWL
ncbi:MAG: hypothetical protein FWC22_06470 [Treponema sp.]|nr:hypothetical protein [Treponema sp.]